MYPQQYFGLFPSTPTEPKVFVLMAFDERHNARWQHVIRPAIEDLELEPHRADTGQISDSILTQILQGIGSSKLVFADVSPLDGYRNPNVMYEIGIAHAAREPTEVVIFRDDNDRLPFDVANVRVNQYDVHPDNDPDKARLFVKSALADALQEHDLSKSMAVQIAMRKLDQTSYNVLVNAIGSGAISHPMYGNMRQALGSLDTLRSLTILLELGLLIPQYPDLYELAKNIGTPEMNQVAPLPVDYHMTELGRAVIMKIVLEHGGERMINDPEISARMQDYVAEVQSKAEESKGD